jgi:DNA-binding response OmpR family regulator
MIDMVRQKLLIVDDESDLRAELTPLLERAGYEVSNATDGEQALAAVETRHPDLIVLDVLMPKMDGREVLRQLRGSGNWTPVILLTRVGAPAERAFSLQEGADDYLNKPFEPLELIARVQAVLRRSHRGSLPLSRYRRLVSGSLVLDRQTRQAWLDGKALSLTARAFGVLEYLMLHAPDVVSRERLLDEVWGWSYAVGTRAVDIRITELRKALDDHPGAPRYIETLVGQGYSFVGQVEGQP